MNSAEYINQIPSDKELAQFEDKIKETISNIQKIKNIDNIGDISPHKLNTSLIWP